MDLNEDSVNNVIPETIKSNACEQIQILKNEADWAEKQQLESEKEIIELKNVVDQLTLELHKTQSETNTKDFQQQKLKEAFNDQDIQIKQLTAEIKKISNEAYDYKRKFCVLSSKYTDLEAKLTDITNEKDKAKEVVELQNKELELLKCQSSKNIIDMQELVQVAEDKYQTLEVETTENINKLSAELAEKSQQIEHLQKSLADQTDDLQARLASIDEREKQVNDAWEQQQNQAILDGLSSKQFSTLEEEIRRLHSVNKELRLKLSKKFSGLPVTLLQDAKSFCTQHVKETLRSFEEANEELRKQLILSQKKVLQFEKEIVECGLRPAKRTFLQPTLSSQNKQRVPLTPACVDKENTNTLTSKTPALFNKTAPCSLLNSESTSVSTNECFPSGAISAKK